MFASNEKSPIKCQLINFSNEDAVYSLVEELAKHKLISIIMNQHGKQHIEANPKELAQYFFIAEDGNTYFCRNINNLKIQPQDISVKFMTEDGQKTSLVSLKNEKPLHNLSLAKALCGINPSRQSHLLNVSIPICPLRRLPVTFPIIILGNNNNAVYESFAIQKLILNKDLYPHITLSENLTLDQTIPNRALQHLIFVHRQQRVGKIIELLKIRKILKKKKSSNTNINYSIESLDKEMQNYKNELLMLMNEYKNLIQKQELILVKQSPQRIFKQNDFAKSNFTINKLLKKNWQSIFSKKFKKTTNNEASVAVVKPFCEEKQDRNKTYFNLLKIYLNMLNGFLDNQEFLHTKLEIDEETKAHEKTELELQKPKFEDTASNVSQTSTMPTPNNLNNNNSYTWCGLFAVASVLTSVGLAVSLEAYRRYNLP